VSTLQFKFLWRCAIKTHKWHNNNMVHYYLTCIVSCDCMVQPQFILWCNSWSQIYGAILWYFACDTLACRSDSETKTTCRISRQPQFESENAHWTRRLVGVGRGGRGFPIPSFPCFWHWSQSCTRSTRLHWVYLKVEGRESRV
jgi:hypothetical protein